MPSRRGLLQSAGAGAALAASPIRVALAANDGVTARLARYMVAARDQALPDASTVFSTPSVRWSPVRA
jgi:hypothetical protein